MLGFVFRSFYTGIGIHSLMSDGTLGPETEVHGFPDGSKINFVSWYSPQFTHTQKSLLDSLMELLQYGNAISSSKCIYF